MNRRILTFLAKVLAIYALWYVAYDLWLLPDGRLDEWLSHNVATVSAFLLDVAGFSVNVQDRIVWITGKTGVEIANGCNGLSTIGLFIGFVVAYPGSPVRRAVFIPVGILLIYVVNVLRVVVMLLLQVYWPAAFDPMHTFGLTTIFYCAVFGLWVLWVNYGSKPAEQAVAPTSA